MTNIWKIHDDWALLGRIGYAGKKKKIRRTEIARKFGEGNWQIAHLVEGKLLSREEALRYFEDGYYFYFKQYPELLEWLVQTASDVYDTAVSNVDSGMDYSIQETTAAHLNDIAIRRALKRLGRSFEGNRLVQVRGKDSEGFALTTGQVPFHKPELILRPQLKGWWEKNSIESFWQSNKVLCAKLSKLEAMTDDIVGVILRRDIRMGKGKFSTQAAHAIVSLLPQKGLNWEFGKKPVEIWTVKGEDHLLGIHSELSKKKTNVSLIRDAGKTQLEPGTRTAVGFGPVNAATLDAIMSRFDAKPLESNERIYRKFSSFTFQKV